MGWRGTPAGPFIWREKWLVDALVAGNRQVRRKFVWDRTRGFASSPDAYGVDLLANFRSQPGATHLGATVTRIRGYVWPDAVGGEAPANPYLAGAIGFRIDAWNEDPLDVDNNPFAQPDEDWMGWLPYFHYRPVGADLRSEITWNAEASPYAVDIKAQRKLEELNQTLWMFFTPPGEGVITYNWDLSIGLKLP